MSIFNFKGLWNSYSNSPYLQDGVGTINDCYMIMNGVAGGAFYIRDLGSGSQSWVFNEFAIYDGSKWQCSLNIGGGGGSTISLTTSGNSGPSTLTSGSTLNIPNYSLYGLGGVPYSRLLTINGVSQDLSADRTWSIVTTSGTVTSVATSGGITGGTITTSGTISLASIAANSVLANTSGSSGVPSSALTYSSTSSASSLVLRDANQNAFANNFSSKATNLVSAGGTTVLTAASSRAWNVTGTMTQTLQLPDATTLAIGAVFYFNNNSTGIVTVTNNGGGVITTIQPGGIKQILEIAASTPNGAWDYHSLNPSNVEWGTNTLVYPGTITATKLITSGGTSSQFVKGDGSLDSTSYGTGTVTSVDLTVPLILSISGSPITSSGTLALSLATQTSGTVFAGPVSGSVATPTFRVLSVSDLPTSIQTGSICFEVDGAGTVIASSATFWTRPEFAGTLTNWYMDADVSGTVTVTIKKNGSDMIGSGNAPALSSNNNQNAACNGSWTTVTFVSGDLITFGVTSPATITKLLCTLKVTKS